MNNIDIPFNKPFIAGKELYYIAEAVIRNRRLAGDGPFTKKCEEWLQNVLGCPRILLTHSCTAALEIVALLCELEPGDEVIMPSYTFVSTANAFVLRGAVPVFLDIKNENLNLDESLIRDAITEKTKGIVPVHYAGVPCNMDSIMAIAREFNLWVAEDAAHSFLSTYKGRYLGTIGRFGCLSFHETKNIICGEGGALLINSEEFVEQADIIREKGTNRSRFFRGEVDKYTWVSLGSSFLPGDLTAAFLYAQLEEAEKIVQSRCKIMDTYDSFLRPLEAAGLIRLPVVEQGDTCNGHLYYVICGSHEERTRLIEFLKNRGIWAVFHYVPLHTSPAGKKFGRAHGELKVTDDLSERLLRLPLFHGMTLDETVTVAEAVMEFYSEASGNVGK
jgi:dTDP-4-amino-4,6-dideoxygalactose transaminase